MAELQDIPVGSQTEAAGTQIVRRTSGIVEEPDQRWLDDDWWEELESMAGNEIPTQAAEGDTQQSTRYSIETDSVFDGIYGIRY